MERARRRWLWGAVALALLLLALFAAWQVSRARCFALIGEVTCRVETRAMRVALSFDDGPTSSGLDAVIPVLAQHDVHATFFLIGRDAERNPELVRKLASAGHEIGNHGYSHTRMVGHLPGFYDREIARTDMLLRRAGAVPARFFRPPYGKKLIGLPLAVQRQGHRMVLWDVEDPQGAADASAYADMVVRRARPGSIILMHPMYPANRIARDALPLVIEGLHARGFEIVTVGELIRGAGSAS